MPQWSGPDARGLILDCDGVLADTEQDGHLPAFNAAFAEFGLPLCWSDADYADKLRIGGGKERIASSLSSDLLASAGIAPDAEARADLIRRVHARKTQLFTERVDGGLLPARPGIARLITTALDAGWVVAVASTSAEASVSAVLRHAVGPATAALVHVFAGDIVLAKKPAPDIYLTVLTDLHLDPRQCVVVEDSRIGLAAARAAGLPVVITTSSYTLGEDFTGASLVLTHLGDPDNPTEVVAAPTGVQPQHLVTLADLEAVITQHGHSGDG